jgi:entericidin B
MPWNLSGALATTGLFTLTYFLRDQMLRNLYAVILLAAVLISGVACNTMKGAGKDIERGGEKLQNAAD